MLLNTIMTLAVLFLKSIKGIAYIFPAKSSIQSLSGIQYLSRAGSWKSAWLFTNSFEIKGTVSARVHYYEDGNVQLNSTKEFKGKKNNLNGCIEFVLLCEKEFQTSLGTFFIQNAVDVFKNLRRALPITKSKIEWPAILSYKIGEELNK